jgi:hypothetical protein
MPTPKVPVDINERRKRRAEILEQYTNSSDEFIESFEAGWRAVWAEECKQKGKAIPFAEWFYSENENGECPFDVAGFGIVSQPKR